MGEYFLELMASGDAWDLYEHIGGFCRQTRNVQLLVLGVAEQDGLLLPGDQVVGAVEYRVRLFGAESLRAHFDDHTVGFIFELPDGNGIRGGLTNMLTMMTTVWPGVDYTLEPLER